MAEARRVIPPRELESEDAQIVRPVPGDSGSSGEPPDGAQQSEEHAAESAKLLQFVQAEGPEAGPQKVEGTVVDDGPKLTPEEAIMGLFGVVLMPCELAGMHRTAELWSPEMQERVAAHLVKVLQKYSVGRTILKFLQDDAYAEELALLMVLGPLVRKTVEAVRADAEELREKAAQAANANS